MRVQSFLLISLLSLVFLQCGNSVTPDDNSIRSEGCVSSSDMPMPPGLTVSSTEQLSSVTLVENDSLIDDSINVSVDSSLVDTSPPPMSSSSATPVSSIESSSETHINTSSSSQDTSSQSNTNVHFGILNPPEFEDLFGVDSVPTFNIIIDQEQLDILNDDPRAEEYVPASFSFGSQYYADVTVRYKGNIGSWLYENTLHTSELSCAARFKISKSSYIYPKTCQKLSLKVKFNTDSSPKQRFYGLKKLQLHSMNNDPSQMREQLGYWVFRMMGIPAPRTLYSRVQINGEDVGLYIAVENIDGRFTKAHFSSGDGNTYKQIMPIDPSNNRHSSDEYRAVLKTNKGDETSVELMKEFARALRDADSDSVTTVIDTWMDIDLMMAHMMVNRLLNHWDSPWALMFNVWDGKNFYWYEDPDNKQFTLVPWDLDNILSGTDDFRDFFDTYGYYGSNMTPFPGVGPPEQCDEPSYPQCNRLFRGFNTFETQYRNQVDTFLRDVYPLLDGQLNTWYNKIAPITREMNELHGDIKEWPGSSEGRAGAIDETYWNYHYNLVRLQLFQNAEEIINWRDE
ncbi:MAG: CotH kinase family protein [Fibrobacterales bacterium]